MHEPMLATMRNGARIEIDAHEYHGRILYLVGTNDPKVSAITCALLQPGDCFLDIGANYSSIGLDAAPIVGPVGHIHLFEPQPKICSRLRQTLADLSPTNITLHEIALFDRDGEMALSLPNHHSGLATLMPDQTVAGWSTQVVQVRDIATYLPPLIAGRPFAAKLDVEGAEIHLLPWLLSQTGLRFLVLEFAHHKREQYELVRESGLALYGLCRTIVRKAIDRIDRFDRIADYHDTVVIRMPQGIAPPRRISANGMGRLLRTAAQHGSNDSRPSDHEQAGNSAA